MSKELEYLRQIRQDFYRNGKVDYDSISFFTSIERALKALEIIREKQVDVRMFYIYNLENYNRLQKNDYCKLTQEENDLLDGALL